MNTQKNNLEAKNHSANDDLLKARIEHLKELTKNFRDKTTVSTLTGVDIIRTMRDGNSIDHNENSYE